MTTSPLFVWYDGNTHVLRFAFRDSYSAPVVGGTVSATITDRDAAEVWSGTLEETEDEGTYETVVPHSAGLLLGPSYNVTIVGTAAEIDGGWRYSGTGPIRTAERDLD